MTTKTAKSSDAFDAYARYYDLLNKGKDYVAETHYVHEIIQRHRAGAETILDIGCGTGAHVAEFAQLGYRVFGVDSSQLMLDAAAGRLSALPGELAQRIDLAQGDARSYRAGHEVDVVTSLFHVMSYQTTNSDIQSAFQTAASHLSQQGLFVFDFWYGPGVLSDPPSVRVRRMEDDLIAALRIAEPVLAPNDNCVDVNYEILVHDKSSGTREVIKETHRMRYFFLPEIRMLLSATGFELLEARAWMRAQAPANDTWNAVVCAVRTGQAESARSATR
jgi:SAM-dependent methyltransferase